MTYLACAAFPILSLVQSIYSYKGAAVEDLPKDPVAMQEPLASDPRIEEILKTSAPRGDLYVITLRTQEARSFVAGAIGTKYSPPGRAGVFLSDLVSNPAKPWFILHEFSHIESYDGVTIPLVSGCASVSAAVTLALLGAPALPVFALSWSVGIAARVVFSRYREGKADDFAIAHSTEEESEAAKRFFDTKISNQASSKDTRSPLLHSLKQFFSDPFHPTLESRSEKIKRSLEYTRLVKRIRNGEIRMRPIPPPDSIGGLFACHPKPKPGLDEDRRIFWYTV